MAEDTLASRLARGAASEVTNQWLGVDDYRRFAQKAAQGNVLGALKSLGAGTLELGGTVAAVLGAPFTAGGSTAALTGLKGAQAATRGGKVLRGLKAAQQASRVGKAAAKAKMAVPRQALIRRSPLLSGLQQKMQLGERASSLIGPAAQQAGRNPLRALGIIDPSFNYRALGTTGGRLRLPTSPGFYTRGAARATGLVPFAGQGLGSFGFQRSVLPRMFSAAAAGPGADLAEMGARTGLNQLSEAEIRALLEAANMQAQAPVSPLSKYLGTLGSP
jgi:hypothetical protein